MHGRLRSDGGGFLLHGVGFGQLFRLLLRRRWRLGPKRLFDCVFFLGGLFRRDQPPLLQSLHPAQFGRSVQQRLRQGFLIGPVRGIGRHQAIDNHGPFGAMLAHGDRAKFQRTADGPQALGNLCGRRHRPVQARTARRHGVVQQRADIGLAASVIFVVGHKTFIPKLRQGLEPLDNI